MEVQNLPKRSSEAVEPLLKRIIICCDGTWQSSVSGEKHIPSNVTRLCRHLASAVVDKDNKEWQQVVFYDSGVGTGALLDLEKTRQGAHGDGLAINVIEATISSCSTTARAIRSSVLASRAAPTQPVLSPAWSPTLACASRAS